MFYFTMIHYGWPNQLVAISTRQILDEKYVINKVIKISCYFQAGRISKLIWFPIKIGTRIYRDEKN